MTTLQKFKLLATQCTVVASSPSRSPSPAPPFHLRRRRTLRNLLTRTASRRRGSDSGLPPPAPIPPSPDQRKSRTAAYDAGLGSRTLKDLFVSSPPPPPPAMRSDGSGRLWDFPPALPMGGVAGRSAGVGTFRNRVIKRVWRPVLMSISESGE